MRKTLETELIWYQFTRTRLSSTMDILIRGSACETLLKNLNHYSDYLASVVLNYSCIHKHVLIRSSLFFFPRSFFQMYLRETQSQSYLFSTTYVYASTSCYNNVLIFTKPLYLFLIQSKSKRPRGIRSAGK